jgi:hypothetical protein
VNPSQPHMPTLVWVAVGVLVVLAVYHLLFHAK